MTSAGLREGEGAPGSQWREGRWNRTWCHKCLLRLLHSWRTFCRWSANLGSGGALGNRWGDCLFEVQSLMHMAEVMNCKLIQNQCQELSARYNIRYELVGALVPTGCHRSRFLNSRN